MIMSARPLVVMAAVAALFLAGCSRSEKPAAQGPIILISVDTLRADRLPAFGYTRLQAPATDRLAADGIVFENAYAHVPLTLPSHVTMITGQLPYQTGIRSNIGFRFDSKSALSLPRALAERGYATGAAVSSYVLRAETGLGDMFDFYEDSLPVHESATLGALQRSGDETTRIALRWIDGLGARPYFLFLHLFEPHSPYEAPEPFRSRYRDPYDAEVASTDAILGRLFAELDRRGMYEGATIILVSDHGEGLGDHGEAEHGVLLYREVLHVPLIVKLPGKRLAGRRVPDPAQLIDLLPTVLSLAGASVPEKLAGTSLLDLAEGRGGRDRTVYSETLYPRLHLGWSELRSLTNARHHYIESPAPELFDITVDPAEKNDRRDVERREAFALSKQLAAVPLNFEAAQPADPEERQRLAALGYLSGAAAGDHAGPRLNPRDHVGVLARMEQAFQLNRQGRYEESIVLSRGILREYPDLVDVHTHLAGTLRRVGRLDEALEAYREAIRRSPQLVDSLAMEVGKLALDMGDLDAAELNAKQTMKLNPAEAHLLLAGVALERRDLATAEKEARLAIGSGDNPRIPALILLARVLAERGKLQEALQFIDTAQGKASSSAVRVPTLESTRGDILARLGRTQEAEEAFRREIATFPTTRLAYVRLVILLASQKRFETIEPTLRAMIDASPSPGTYRLAARVASDLGNEKLAATYRRGAEAVSKRTHRRGAA